MGVEGKRVGKSMPAEVGVDLVQRVGLARFAALVAQSFFAERDRWPLWLPVLLGFGIAVYFALPEEPPAAAGAVALLLILGATAAGRRWALAPLLGGALAVAALGFAASQWAAARQAGPVIPRETGPVTVQGRVTAVQVLGPARRVELDQVTIERLAEAPLRIRLRLSRNSPAVTPGQRISVRAVLRPPPPPSLPGGYDFARAAWFEGLGAVGYAVTAAQVTGDPAGGGEEAFALWLADLRYRVTQRIAGTIGGEAGAVAAALITGERAAVSEQTWDAYRDSGLAHLLSISGLHFSMVAGLVFLVVRGALAALPWVALRFAIKKWTAAVALAATFFYLLLSGATVPTQRSFAMIAIVLLAVLVDRAAISMRTVAWAALAVLLWQPQALVGASFQMSFAAVVALVAGFEAAKPYLTAWRGEGGVVRWLALYLGGVSFTTLVAGSATALYTIHHFSRFATWSLAGNLLAVPLTGVVVMPAGLLAMVLMPFGLDGPALAVMGWGVEICNRLAAAVASWPGAAVVLTPPPAAAMALFSLGGLWLCLWRRRWRLWGLPPMLVALAWMPFAEPPDLLIDGNGELMAVRGADGGLLLSTLKRGGFVRGAWVERAGQGVPPRSFAEAAAADRLSCDSAGCLWRGGGRAVALVRRPEALAEDCAVAAVVVSVVPIRRPCPSAQVTVDRIDLWRQGPHALWLDGPRVLSVRAWRGERPWVIRPEAARHRQKVVDAED